MFEIKEITGGDFNKIILQNKYNRAEIIPNCGAILNAWHINKDDNWINVIKGYDSEKDFRDNCETKGFRSCKLSPYVCRIRDGKYVFKEDSYVIGKFGFDRHMIHGLIYDASYEVVMIDACESYAKVELTYEFKGQDAGFPFNYSIRIAYILSERHELNINTTIKNNHSAPIPISDGWHPYFTLGGKINDYKLQLSGNKIVEFDDELIPTGKLLEHNKFSTLELIGNNVLDTCFILDDPYDQVACTLTNEKEDIQLCIQPKSNYPYLQIFTPDDRESIAIENLSAAPDAFNNGMGLMYLEAQKEKVFKTIYKVSEFKL